MNIRTAFSLAVILLFTIAGAALCHAGVIDPELETVLSSAGSQERIPVIVQFSDKVDVHRFRSKDRKVRRNHLLKALKARHGEAMASSTLTGLLGSRTQRGEERVRPLWIINGFAIKARPQTIRMISRKPAVETVRLDGWIRMVDPGVPISGAAEWNLAAVGAQALWELGYSGQGVVVASLDSGVDATHPDLVDRWRGGTNSWFDANDPDFDPLLDTRPYDLDGHGTAVMSVLLGGNASGSYIGVAPGAKWMAAKVFDETGTALASEIHAAFQWLLDPDGDPDTDDGPDIVNNSWGFVEEPDVCIEGAGGVSFRTDIQVLKQAGMAVVFSAGNGGPYSYTSVSPANYPESFSVGSVDETQTLSGFSARGPSACDAGVYPSVVAPGDGVNFPFGIMTADVNIGQPYPYTFATGTSFAAPHAAGAMALLLSAYPDLTPEQLETALKTAALDLGPSGPDNEYGYGLIDVKKAYLQFVDQVLITNAVFSEGKSQLLVEATSTSQPDVTLSAEGYGNVLWDEGRNLYRRVFPNVTAQPASVTVNSSGGGSAAYDFPAADTVTITNAVFSEGKSQLLVEATSTSQPDVTLGAGGYGNLLWDEGRSLYRRVFANVAASPAAVTVNSSGGGSTTYDFPAADTVTITKVVYSIVKSQLLVEAMSSQPGNLLEAEGYGNLLWDQARNLHRRVFPNVPAKPANVTVSSSAGGSDTMPLP